MYGERARVYRKCAHIMLIMNAVQPNIMNLTSFSLRFMK